MGQNFWGRKIGMTQVFSQDKVIPVTVIDVSGWYVIQIKNQAKDGYDAVQVGLVRKKFVDKPFSLDWVKNKKYYFEIVREVSLENQVDVVEIGQHANFFQQCVAGEQVHVAGTTKGCGYAGVVRRHRFRGAPASHGHTMGKKPGALSFMRSRGRVIKGKRLPGQMGGDRRMMKNLEVVKIDNDAGVVVIKGAVPGKAGSVVFVQKA